MHKISLFHFQCMTGNITLEPQMEKDVFLESFFCHPINEQFHNTSKVTLTSCNLSAMTWNITPKAQIVKKDVFLESFLCHPTNEQFHNT